MLYNERVLRLEIDTKGRNDMSNNRPENAVVLIPSLEPDERLPRYVKALLATVTPAMMRGTWPPSAVR